ncbi:tautomerase family protein [Antarcticirhabdus aurantiaca]|uniref:Tautomerase family protein n=1 Tax=Antarcticirhabdus aurantiaca TaxID=2606717 RepID=A0ACD4NN44_9HYPH|nr:tautomerase family protein [Antarcticirhabdus aurantiaca]WAJ28287.1 tautomerase family protein [Jeongeuplla avenae]
MPFVHIRVAGLDLAPPQVETLQREATRLMADAMGKKAELTAVLVEIHDAARWSIGGRPVPAAAHLDVRVTEGTNSEDEKAEFIRQAHGLLARVVGPDLPLATYVVVDEVPADAWGYGGSTQAMRRAAAA